MKNILVPIGSSKNAASHLQYAIDFAENFGAKIFIVQIGNIYTKPRTNTKVEGNVFINNLISEVDTKNVKIIVKKIKGKLIDIIQTTCKRSNIDLILIEPRTNSIKKEVFLGKTSGKIIKQTQIPTLIVPEGYIFKPIKFILMAMKSAVIKKKGVLTPLKQITNQFKIKIDLLLVLTPYYREGDFEINSELKSLSSRVLYEQKPTTYLGALEYFKIKNSDLLCVVRRKRGFFKKIWEDNIILKKDFNSKIPVLVLSELT